MITIVMGLGSFITIAQFWLHFGHRVTGGAGHVQPPCQSCYTCTVANMALHMLNIQDSMAGHTHNKAF